jgi:hypothetical protein
VPDRDVLLVLCVAAAMVIVINAGLALGLLRSRTAEQIRLARAALNRARDPWGEEDQALVELHRRVIELSEAEAGEPGTDEA